MKLCRHVIFNYQHFLCKDHNQTTIIHAGVYVAPGGKIEGGGINAGLIASNVGQFDGEVNAAFNTGKKIAKLVRSVGRS